MEVHNIDRSLSTTIVNLHQKTYVWAETVNQWPDNQTLPYPLLFISFKFIRRYFTNTAQANSDDPKIGFTKHESCQNFPIPFGFVAPALSLLFREVGVDTNHSTNNNNNLYWKQHSNRVAGAVQLDSSDDAIARFLSIASGAIRDLEADRRLMSVVVENRSVVSLEFYEELTKRARSTEETLVWETEETLVRVMEETLVRVREEVRSRVVAGEDSSGLRDLEENLISVVEVLLTVWEEEQTLVTGNEDLQWRITALWSDLASTLEEFQSSSRVHEQTLIQTLVDNIEQDLFRAQENLQLYRVLEQTLVRVRAELQFRVREADIAVVRARAREDQLRFRVSSMEQTLDRCREEPRVEEQTLDSTAREEQQLLRSMSLDEIVTMVMELLGLSDVGVINHPRPAKKSTVEALEKSTVLDQSLTCVVCMENVVVGSEITRMPCSHDFHSNCILKWLKKNHTCPLCRFKLPTNGDG